MARRSSKPEYPKPPLLLAVPHSEAHARLKERIDKGQPLLNRSIRSFGELEEAKRDIRAWSAYNVEMLRRLFTSPEVAEQYLSWRNSGSAVLSLERNLSFEVRQCIDGVKDKICCIESVIERLELIPEDPGAAPASHRPTALPQATDSSRVFVVHGHDQETRETVVRFLEKIGVDPVVLHEHPSDGRTIIEKLEHYGNVAFAVVLLTPDDVGKAASSPDDLHPRARQNVVLELGYFIGRLERSHVCALHKGDLELPSDYMGVAYVPFDNSGGWKIPLVRELKSAGFHIDANEIL